MYDRLKSGSWTRWFVALVIGIALFLLRRKYLGGADPPDSFWQGYTAAQVADFLRQIGPRGRSLYAWTQPTLDVVFPVVYTVCIARPIARTAPPAIGPLLIWLPFVVAASIWLRTSRPPTWPGRSTGGRRPSRNSPACSPAASTPS